MASLKHTVMNVLKSPAATKIDFHLGLINVDAAGITQIRLLVSGEWIPIAISKMNNMTEAEYAYQANTLLFPRQDYGANFLEKATIVHECIHALHDLYGGGTYYYPHHQGGSRLVRRSENEAAAYVAASLYHLHETGTPLPGGPIFQIAGAIAQRIVNRHGAFVSTAEAKALRIEIVKFAKSSSDPRDHYEYDDLTIADGP